MIIQIQNQTKERTPRSFIHTWLDLLVRELKKRRVHTIGSKQELVIVMVPPQRMKKINFQFRGKEYATDILSFEPYEPTSVGELVICPQVLKRQSKEHGLTYREELGYMLIHGVLHLLGFDHETNERDAKRMFALQDDLFEVLCQECEPGTKR